MFLRIGICEKRKRRCLFRSMALRTRPEQDWSDVAIEGDLRSITGRLSAEPSGGQCPCNRYCHDQSSNAEGF